MNSPLPSTRRRRLFGHLAAALRALAPPVYAALCPLHAAAALDRCERCGSGLVCPVEYEQLDEMRWEVHLRCGDCAGQWATVTSPHALAFDLIDAGDFARR